MTITKESKRRGTLLTAASAFGHLPEIITESITTSHFSSNQWQASKYPIFALTLSVSIPTCSFSLGKVPNKKFLVLNSI